MGVVDGALSRHVSCFSDFGGSFMAADFEFGMDGIALFATRQRNRKAVWWVNSPWFDERLILGDDALTEDLFNVGLR